MRTHQGCAHTDTNKSPDPYLFGPLSLSAPSPDSRVIHGVFVIFQSRFAQRKQQQGSPGAQYTHAYLQVCLRVFLYCRCVQVCMQNRDAWRRSDKTVSQIPMVVYFDSLGIKFASS